MLCFFFLGVDAFKPDNISETVLLRLLKHDIMFHIKMKDKEKLKDDPSFIIYQQVSNVKRMNCIFPQNLANIFLFS